MKQYSKKLLSLVVLCSTTASMLQAEVLPFIQWRSEGRDTARKLYGQTAYGIYQQDEDTWDGSLATTLQYDQSFRDRNIARCLFGDSLIGNPANATTSTDNCHDKCGDETLVIQGSQVANKLERSWMAENFLLARDFQSAITFSPKVQNVVVDFDLYVGFNRWVNGMYFRLYGPVNWNKASLRAEETNINPGTATTITPPAIGGGYTQGYFDPATQVSTQSLFNNALQFFGGCQLPTYNNESVTVQPLEFAKFSDCIIPGTNPCDSDCGNTSHRKTGFAELRGELGWNYFRERCRFLINIQAAAPTGSRPNAEYLFPAQIGNGKHWELGVGLGGAYKFWRSEDEEKCFSFIWEADITHMFAAKQKRTFDLKGKPNSRYMLAEKVTNNSFIPADSRLTNSTISFANEYAPVANFSTRDIKVSIGVQGDVVAMFNYTVRGFSWDLGYNFWGMSTSKIKLNNCADECHGVLPFPENTWALKGDASVAGTAFGLTTNLGATESQATIFNGTNGLVIPPVTTPVTPSALTNPNIDNPVEATTNTGTIVVTTFTIGAAINTSNPAVLISVDDLDIKGAEQRGLSNKVFTHFSYTWTKNERWLPFVGAGLSAQFGMHSGHGNDCDDECPTTPVTTTNDNDCGKSQSCALSNWAIFVKGGVSFH